MQQKKSVNFNDWKIAFKEGFDGFILGCSKETSEKYITQFESLSEVKGTPVFRSDGVHVKFNRDKPREIKIQSFKNLPLILSVAALIFSVIVLVFTLQVKKPIEETHLSKNILVQGNIIPRECYIIPSPVDVGYSLMIIDANNADIRFYIEVNDPDLFIMKYLEKTK